MSIYMTEAEQIEAIKKWWRRYNNIITIALSILLLAISGYKYWSWHQEKINQQASMAYEQLMVAFSNQDNRGVKAYANQLQKDFAHTVYADSAQLTLAKLYSLREQYDKAEKVLDAVAQNSRIPALQQIAQIRLARLLMAEKSYDKALEQLAKMDNTAYMPIVHELRGDIYAARGEYSLAASSYQQAVKDARSHGIGNLFLEMKTNELAAMPQTSNQMQQPVKTA